MALLASLVLLAAHLRISTADFSLKVQPEVIGTWKSSVVLPCSYSPTNLTRDTVTWLFNGESIFHSDSGGDHTFITRYRGKLSLPENRQGGDVSLTIMNLQMDDRGVYTCQVSLTSRGATDRIQKGAEINLDVVRVAVTKPVIQAGETFLKTSQGSTVKLTCSAEGSPPISYRWYKRSSGSTTYQASGTSFTIANADPSHSGIYYCDAENRSPEKTVQRSEELELSVTAVAVEPTNPPEVAMHSSVGMVTSKLPAGAGDDRHRSSAPTSTEAVAVEPTNPPEVAMHSSVGMVTSKLPAGAGDDRHRSSAPTSTEDGTLRRTSHSTRKTNVIVGPTGSAGDRRAQTTDGTLRQNPHSTWQANVIVGPTGSAGDRGAQATGATGRGGLPLYLIILIAVLCLAVLCALVAFLATRCRHKGSGQISEMAAMSALNAQANQAPPAVNICQINISQNNGCQNVTMPRIENAYGPAMTQEPAHDESSYQNLLIPQENVYELPLTKKEKMNQL